MTAVIGADLALVRNSSAFVAAYALNNIITIGEIEELKPERKQPLKLSEVVARGCDFAERHGARVLHADHHVLEPAREHLRSGFAIEPVDGSGKARTERFTIVRNLFNENRIRIPACYGRLAVQLRDVVGKASSGGVLQAHGDLAAAFVVAVSIAAHKSGVDWSHARRINDMITGRDRGLNEPPLPNRDFINLGRWHGYGRGFG
jgi:hypothetical protein